MNLFLNRKSTGVFEDQAVLHSDIVLNISGAFAEILAQVILFL